jgi:hypothetical protein
MSAEQACTQVARTVCVAYTEGGKEIRKDDVKDEIEQSSLSPGNAKMSQQRSVYTDPNSVVLVVRVLGFKPLKQTFVETLTYN